MDLLFLLKKIVTCCLIPPGIFIAACLAAAFVVRKKAAATLIAIAAAIYVSSVAPFGDLLLGPLERAYPIPTLTEIRRCDAYVILGGGTNPAAPTIDGSGLPSPDALYRVMAAYRLFLIDRKPILVSGGSYPGGIPEAEVVKKYLVGLGVNERYIITESKSKDTYENARYTKIACEEWRIRRILLITSAYHMKRSVMLFEKLFGPVTPFPTGARVSGGSDFLSWIPDVGNTVNTAAALREYIGILYYKVTL